MSSSASIPTGTQAGRGGGGDRRVIIRKGTRERPRRGLSQKGGDRLLALFSVLVVLALWETLVRADVISADFFPPPTQITKNLWEQAGNGKLLSNLLITLRRVTIGYVLGTAPALLVGLSMGFIRPLRIALRPIISATYPIPKSAIVPLLLLIFGFGEASKWSLVAIASFFPVVLSASSGVLQISTVYQDVAMNCGATRRQYFWTVALPGAMPSVMTGMQLAFGQALILVTIAEIVGAKSGIGFLIWNSWQIFDVKTMYVGLMTIAVVGATVATLLRMLERRLLPWDVSERPRR